MLSPWSNLLGEISERAGGLCEAPGRKPATWRACNILQSVWWNLGSLSWIKACWHVASLSPFTPSRDSAQTGHSSQPAPCYTSFQFGSPSDVILFGEILPTSYKSGTPYSSGLNFTWRHSTKCFLWTWLTVPLVCENHIVEYPNLSPGIFWELCLNLITCHIGLYFSLVILISFETLWFNLGISFISHLI